MCLDCVGAVVAAESNVEELWRLTQLAKTRADVRFEIVPPEKKKIEEHSQNKFLISSKTHLKDIYKNDKMA